MNAFDNFADLANALKADTAQMNREWHGPLEIIGRHLEAAAKAKIGHYQEGWPQLAPATEERKARQGFPEDAPLLATGDLRESIGHTIGHMEVTVGAKDKKMVYHEWGTLEIPPRPVFASLLEENKDFTLDVIARVAVDRYQKTGNMQVPGVIFEVPPHEPRKE